MPQIVCLNCDGKGWQLYMDNGCPNQEMCEMCKGEKMLLVTNDEKLQFEAVGITVLE